MGHCVVGGVDPTLPEKWYGILASDRGEAVCMVTAAPRRGFLSMGRRHSCKAYDSVVGMGHQLYILMMGSGRRNGVSKRRGCSYRKTITRRRGSLGLASSRFDFNVIIVSALTQHLHIYISTYLHRDISIPRRWLE
jgi:hypothetical protein